MTKRVLLLFIFQLGCYGIALSQSADLDHFLSPVIPPSPNASALGQYGDVPVSLYTGVPQIHIPLFEVRGRKLNLPVSLSYHAGGIKVNQMSSWVGLGWTLNAGGVITRSVRGLPDEKPDVGYYAIADRLPAPADASTWSPTADFQDSIAKGICDAEPDVYYFNFAGRSGQFIIDKNLHVHTIPHQNLMISNVGDDTLPAWEIITEDGTKYFFGTSTDTTATEETHTTTTSTTRTYNEDFYSSWYLVSIMSVDNTDSIKFYYSGEPKIVMPASVTQSIYSHYAYVGTNWSSQSVYNSSIWPLTLDSIVSINSRIEFAVGDDRKDLVRHNVLQSINVYDKKDNLVKGFTFTQSYFVSTGGKTPEDNLRLRLDAMTEIGADGSVKPPYSFNYYVHLWPTDDPMSRIVRKPGDNVDPSYYAQPFPPRGSYAQDHWGYYNGSDTNKSLVPAWYSEGRNENIILYGAISDGGYRGTDTNYLQTGTLNKITYPTGGSTSFEYEGNNFHYVGVTENYNFHNWFCGGVRIKKISIYDGISHTHDIVKEYRYTMGINSDSSSGVLVIEPNYGYNQTVNGKDYYVRTSISHSELGATHGSHIGYKQVIVLQTGEEGNGRTEYYFTSAFDYPDAGVTGYPFPPTISHDWKRGLLTEMKQYDKYGVLVEDVNNEYEFRTDDNVNYVPGVKVGFASYSSSSASYTHSYYTIKSEWRYLSSTTKTVYDKNGSNPVTSTTNYYYDNPVHAQLSREVITDSKGVQRTIKNRYPDDYPAPEGISGSPGTGVGSTDTTAAAVHRMKRHGLHMSNYIIEQEQMSGGNVLSATIRKVKEFRTDQILPYQVLSLETDQPLSDYAQSTIETSNSFSYDNRCILRGTYDKYDSYGNNISFTVSKGTTTPYLWGYNNSLLVAEVKNAPLNHVAYTSFESDQKGNWNYSDLGVMPSGKTGKKCYNLASGFITGPITPLLGATDYYILSFWVLNGSFTIRGAFPVPPPDLTEIVGGEPDGRGWKYYEYKIVSSGGFSLSGTGFIDELRYYPASAQMVTYTYDPLIGITSKCNENNQVTTYEYDDFGRLKLMRDNDGNIREHYEYHYGSH